ncbi:hypothetical protein [Enterovibrio norvegicus]|uniref:hypothetical protein n=1 Tax=Enterovibrio norvegicus TaxID=188144 RepID=UPI0013D51550|nr:hypothetical protein [Enterovibrio norvegicus]
MLLLILSFILIGNTSVSYSYILIITPIIPFFVAFEFRVGMLFDFLFSKIPCYLTFNYLRMPQKYSFYKALKNNTNENIAIMASSIFYSLRSVEPRDILSKTIFLFSFISLINTGEDSSLIAIYQSMLAAVIFDFIVIRIPLEYKKEKLIAEVSAEIHTLMNALLGIRHLTVKSKIGMEAINELNIYECIKSIKEIDYSSKPTSCIHISNSPHFNAMREQIRQKKGFVSINDEICIIIKETFDNLGKLSLKIDLLESHGITKYLYNFGGGVGILTGIMTYNIKGDNSNNSLGYDLSLSDHSHSTSFIDGYLIPLEGICYWYKRKILKYTTSYKPLIEFNVNSTSMHMSYTLNRCYASKHFDPDIIISKV